MSVLMWILFGALAGWIASIIKGKNAQMGAFANIGVGIVGAMIGGFIVALLGGDGVNGFSLWSLIVATGGAVLFLSILDAARSTR